MRGKEVFFGEIVVCELEVLHANVHDGEVHSVSEKIAKRQGHLKGRCRTFFLSLTL